VKYEWSDTLEPAGRAVPHPPAVPVRAAGQHPEGFTFVQQGDEVHTGLELNAAGQLSDNLRLTASANLIQARAQDTGTPSYEGHQIVNVPRLRTARTWTTACRSHQPQPARWLALQQLQPRHAERPGQRAGL
jgi:iron complex outermembrane receptor protein